MRTLLRLLLSRSYAAGALGLLAVLLGLAALVPDGERLRELGRVYPRLAATLEALRPAEVVRSPILLVIAAWVAAAIVASMVTRVRARRGARAVQGPPSLERFQVRRELRVDSPPDEAARRVRAAVRAAGFPVHAELAGSRGGAGFWGSMAFHAGLLLVLFAVVLSARLRFHGDLVLTEGFPFPLEPKVFLRAEPAAALAGLRGVRIAVSDVTASYREGSQLTDVSAVLEVDRPGSNPVRRFVSVNVPVDLDEFQLALSSYGVAPELHATDPAGATRLDGSVVLHALPPGTEDTVFLAGGGILRLRYYPEHVLDGGRDATASMFPIRPVLAFQWYEGGKRVAEGRVARGEEARVAGYRLSFPEFAYWLRLDVTRDPGVPWFAFGSLVAVLGLAVRFTFGEEAWRARITPATGGALVEITLSARYHPARLEVRARRFVEAIQGGTAA